MENETILFKFPISEILNRFKPVIAEIITQELTRYVKKEKYEADELLTKGEAAKLLCLSLPSITKHTRNGLLKGYRIGRNIRYKRAEVISAMELIKAIPK